MKFFKKCLNFKWLAGIWGKVQENYFGQIKVSEDDNGMGTIVTWTGSFDSFQDSSTDFYRVGLESLAKLFPSNS